MTKSRGIVARQVAWTDSENALLREHYPAGAAAALAVLPGRSHSAVNCRAAEMGVSVDMHRFRAEQSKDARVQQIVTHLRTVPEGSTSVDCAAALDMRPMRVTDLAKLARKAGLIVSFADPRAGKARTLLHFAAEHAPKEPPQKPLRRTKQRTAAPKLQGDAIITPDTVVTLCPHGEDTRYRVTSAPRVVDSSECRDWAAAL